MKITTRGSGRGVAGALSALLLSSVAFAEGPAINGYVDTQYIYSFEKPKTRTNALRSYDAMDNNITSTAHLAITGKLSEEASYTVEVDAGNDADTTSGTSGEDVVIQEGYLTYVGGAGFGFKAGKFATFEGIEVIESVANPTISRGFLYGLAEPFTHVGGVLTYAMEKVDFAVGAVNGWDLQDDNNKGKTIVAKAGFNFGDPLSFTVSGLHGPEQASVADDPTTVGIDETDNRSGANRSSVDFTGVTKLIPNVDLWFQANYGQEQDILDGDGDGVMDDDDTWGGFTVQPVINISDKFSVGARYEYFANSDGSRVGGTDDFSAYNVTIAPAYKLTDNVVIRLEGRQDKSNKKVFTDEDGMADDTNTTVSTQVAVTF